MTAFKSKAGTPAAADVPLLLYILPFYDISYTIKNYIFTFI